MICITGTKERFVGIIAKTEWHIYLYIQRHIFHYTSPPFATVIGCGPGVAHPLDQIYEFQQVSGTKTSLPSGDDKERIRRGQIGPRKRQRGAMTVPVKKVHPVFAPAMTAFDRAKLLTEPWVEWVSNAKGSVRTCCIARSW
jgi:hypothetical protein